MQHSQYELNARNLLCPLPVIRTQDRVKELEPGDRLVVTCTDPGALHDIPAWCRINGHRVVDSSTEARDISITIEVGA
jgi:tRNA 2-thiouridine synthesizing protein A